MIRAITCAEHPFTPAPDSVCRRMLDGLEGRYEWEWKAGTPPRFFFALPGIDIQVSIALPPGTLLASPDELRDRRQLTL